MDTSMKVDLLSRRGPEFKLMHTVQIHLNATLYVSFDIPYSLRFLPFSYTNRYISHALSSLNPHISTKISNLVLEDLASRGWDGFYIDIYVELEYLTNRSMIEINFDGSSRSKEIFIRWDPPPHGWVKLNTDGSSLGNPGLAGAGGVIRNNDGEWIMGFYSHLGIANSTEAELLALKMGLELLINLGFSKVVVEIDAKTIVDQLLEGTSCLGESYHTLLAECKSLLYMLAEAKMQHRFREANFVADCLAKEGAKCSSNFVMHDKPPNFVWTAYDADLKGVSYPRTV